MEHRTGKVTAVVLAAGFSSRMGAFKPLLPLAGATVIDRVINNFKQAGIEEIIVVTGHNREAVSEHIAWHNITEAHNPDYAQGMFTSVLAGVSKAKKCGADAFLLTPVDVPLFAPETVRALLDAKGGAMVAYPAYNGEKGHPVLIDAGCVPAILAHNGDGGLRAVLATFDAQSVTVETDDVGCVTDMDTWDDYQRIVCMEGGA